MKEWHLDRIPKIAYFYWGTKEFPWVRFLTLETFRKHHPDWRMVLHRKYVLDDYDNQEQQKISCWNMVKELGIEIECIDVEEELGVDFPVKYITIYADTYRYIVLKRTGGFYVDMDNLFFRSLEDMPWNKPENSSIKTFMLQPPFHHILLAQTNAPVLSKIQYKQLQVLPATSDRILDTTACTAYVPINPEDEVQIWPFETTEESFKADGPVNENALALNWHGSGTYGKYMGVTEANYKDLDHPLAAVIRYCLHGDMGKPSDLGQFQWIARGE